MKRTARMLRICHDYGTDYSPIDRPRFVHFAGKRYTVR